MYRLNRSWLREARVKRTSASTDSMKIAPPPPPNSESKEEESMKGKERRVIT